MIVAALLVVVLLALVRWRVRAAALKRLPSLTLDYSDQRAVFPRVPARRGRRRRFR